MHFAKYQALGNDYLVCLADNVGDLLTPSAVQRICDRHFGIGSDGILVGSTKLDENAYPLRIVNPDGTEAEKSGNGLRIFARYLWDLSVVTSQPFFVATLGGVVRCQLDEKGRQIAVDMGTVSFLSDEIPVTGSSREVLKEVIEVNGDAIEVSAATIGNPHCVVFRDALLLDEVHRLGPALENAPCFPRRANVQFVRIVNRKTIAIEIWERGAGYTLASGSSGAAAAAVAHRLGLVDSAVTVQMAGGELRIDISENYEIRLQGPASKVADIELADEFWEGVGGD
jgi:diaminopimelate epimerase